MGFYAAGAIFNGKNTLHVHQVTGGLILSLCYAIEKTMRFNFRIYWFFSIHSKIEAGSYTHGFISHCMVGLSLPCISNLSFEDHHRLPNHIFYHLGIPI